LLISREIRLANKKDLEGTVNADQLFEKLNLRTLFPGSASAYSNEYDSPFPFRIQECSALYFEKAELHFDPRIQAGVKWLVDTIKVRQGENAKKSRRKMSAVEPHTS
jgi:hypothetical protein